MKNYTLGIPTKTKVINVFRLFFKIKWIESFLVKNAGDISPTSFYGKLIPANYQYPANSIRFIQRNGINYKLDISDLVDHYIYFGFKEISRNKLYSLVKPGMTILDIGANMGSTALNFSKITGNNGQVIAFEPDKINFEKAQTNISLNTEKIIKLYNIGLGNENKNYKLYAVNDGNRGMNRILDNGFEFPYSEITVKKLDDIFPELAIKKIDLIKIDVEGFEMKVLEGGITILKTQRPVLFIELDNDNLLEQGSSSSKLISFLHSLDYKVFHSETNALITSDQNFDNTHFDIYALPEK